jgi:hypothetical protein
VRDHAVAVPRVEFLARRREQRREALVELDAVGFGREEFAIDRDRAAPVALRPRARCLLEKLLAVESLSEPHSETSMRPCIRIDFRTGRGP